jgi:hypothetical protein
VAAVLGLDFLRFVFVLIGPDVWATGLHEFGYGLGVISFLAASDSWLILDKNRWQSDLNRYTIDDKPGGSAHRSGSCGQQRVCGHDNAAAAVTRP